MKKIILLIGFGSIGKKHFQILKKKIHFEKILILQNKKKIKKNLLNDKIQVIQSFDQIIDNKVNFAIISSPASSHLDYAKKLAQKNINILIEKPLSDKFDLKKYKELSFLIKKNKLKCFVGFVFRHDDLLINFKKILDKINPKLINNVYSDHLSYLPDWRNSDYRHSVSAIKNLGGGVVLESSHEIDYLLYLFESLNVQFSQTKNSGDLNIDVEDSANIVFVDRFKKNIFLNLNFNSKIQSRKCEVQTKKVNITCDFNKRIIYSIDFKNNYKILYKSKYKLYDAYVAQIKNFLSNKSNSKYNHCDIQQGIINMSLIKQILYKNF